MKHLLGILSFLMPAGNCKSQSFHCNVTDSTHYIYGKVISAETKQPAPYCTILLMRDSTIITSTLTDIDGKYKLFIPDTLINKQLTIKTDYIGWISENKELKASDLPKIMDFQVKGATKF